MKAKAVRLHGANDLRLDEFELPEIKEDEILVKVVSDSVCMSTYKCAILGVNHKRVHEDVADYLNLLWKFRPYSQIQSQDLRHQTKRSIVHPYYFLLFVLCSR